MNQNTDNYLKPPDIKKLLISAATLFILMIPLYYLISKQKQKQICASNLKDIYASITTYASLNDDHYPEICATDQQGGPIVNQKGLPYTWASQIQPYMNKRSNFVCPAAGSDENDFVQYPTSSEKSIEINYGMYVARSKTSIASLHNLGSLALISETSGNNNVYNPHQLITHNRKELSNNNFFIGYDNNNWTADQNSCCVTRLAYKDTTTGHFTKNNPGRHQGGNHFLLASGQLLVLPATAAKIERRNQDITGLWALR